MNFIKPFFIFVIFLSNNNFISAQQLHHSMLSSQGKSTFLKSGNYISQTIGQQSIIGSNKFDKFSIIQGFQQSTWLQLISDNTPLDISVVSYPNPFSNTINFSFNNPLDGSFQFFVFDTAGRLIVSKNTTTINNTITENLYFLPAGIYLVQLKNKTITHYTKIIKD